jgi:hypothetical protein
VKDLRQMKLWCDDERASGPRVVGGGARRLYETAEPRGKEMYVGATTVYE